MLRVACRPTGRCKDMQYKIIPHTGHSAGADSAGPGSRGLAPPVAPGTGSPQRTLHAGLAAHAYPAPRHGTRAQTTGLPVPPSGTHGDWIDSVMSAGELVVLLYAVGRLRAAESGAGDTERYRA